MQSNDFYNPDFDIIFQKLTPHFLRDADVQINVQIGDLNYGETKDQDIDFILITKKGQFFWTPTLGYDTQRLQNTRINRVQENAALTAELRKDGFNEITDLLLGQTSDPDFVEAVRAQDRGLLPTDSLVINVNANRL